MRASHFFLLACALLAGCDRGGDAARPGAGQGLGAARKYPVETAIAALEPLIYRIEAPGAIEAEDLVQVAAEVEGAIGAVQFREGDRVDPSKVLVEVDPERYKLILDRLEATVARARADLDEKNAALKKRMDLRAREQGWVPEEEITHHQAQVAQATAAVAEAQAQRELAARDLARARVRAPIEGVIERRAINTGEYVRPGTVIATIVRTRPVRVRFSLRDEEASKLAAGAKIGFTTASYPGERFTGEIFFVARSADPRTRRVDALARHANEDERLKPGSFAKVDIEAPAPGGAILLPESSVLATEEGFIAFVVEGGKAKKRLIQIGLQTPDGRIEVRRGIQAGDTIIVRGAGNLLDGVDVAPQPVAAPTAKPAGSAS